MLENNEDLTSKNGFVPCKSIAMPYPFEKLLSTFEEKSDIFIKYWFDINSVSAFKMTMRLFE